MLVRLPPEPVMLPDLSVTVDTVSLNPPIANVPPLTVSFVASAMRFDPPSDTVPPTSVTFPVPAETPVASIVTAPVARRN